MNVSTAGTIDPEAPWITHFPDEARARAYVQALQQRHPKVEPAYRPSGKFGAAAIPLLVAGSLGGAIVATLTGLLVGAFGFLAWGALSWAASGDGRAGGKLILWLLDVVVFLVGWFGTFATVGVVAALVIDVAGRRGKNRNATLAAGFAIPPAVVGTVALIALPLWLRGQIVEVPSMLDFSWAQMLWMLTDVSWLHYVGLLLGAVLSVGIAWTLAGGFVAKTPYCETCDRGMVSMPVAGISFDELPLLVQQRRDAVLPLAAPRERPDVTLTLHRCDECGCGTLDASAFVMVSWPKGSSNDTYDTTWLIHSAVHTPAEIAGVTRR